MATRRGLYLISAIMNYFDGTPLGFAGSSPISAWNGAANRANIAAGDMKNASFGRSAFELSNTASPRSTYLNKSLFADPLPLTLGTSAYRYTQARNFGTVSFGLQKNQTFHDKYKFQLRAEFLNAFNRHQLGGINTIVTSPLFGQATSVSGNRVIQLGTRLDF